MARNEIVTSQPGPVPAERKTAKQAYDLLVLSVARDNGVESFDPSNISNVELRNGRVVVEYVDKASATDFDPTPVKHISADVK